MLVVEDLRRGAGQAAEPGLPEPGEVRGERLTEPAPAPPAASAGLSPRELDVVRAVARGRTNHEISGDLFVSLSTVKTHLAAAQSKISARNRVETASWAWRLVPTNRIVPPSATRSRTNA